MENKSIIVLLLAAVILVAAAFTPQPEFSGVTYNTSELLPRTQYSLRSSGGDKFNINTISEDMLKTLPRIGKHAEEICALRDELGGFSSLEELSLVEGIGPGTVDYAAEILKIK